VVATEHASPVGVDGACACKYGQWKYVNAERISTYSSSQRWTIITIVVSCPLPFFVHRIRLIVLAILIFVYRGWGHLTLGFHVAISRTGRLPPFAHVVPSARVMVRTGP
jgi:hypothetical protein